jgi:transcriptional regulator with XRE-family HTH domain
MEPRKSVRQLCEERGIDPTQLADRAMLEERRVRAIVEGRWTPSPTERTKIADAFELTPDDIAWDHQVPVQHLYGHGPQFGRTP